ncbi:LSU ribosomal protein L4p (L1e) [Clostridiaceae bacterium JG1575]|nr:LSU ribosomal protein L4p (L1e) [Clostridiaceae bacterium JG1575]
MPKVGVYNMEGSQIGDLELNASVFEYPVNEAAMHQVILAIQANKRQGTQSAKTRAEVSGGGKKPYKQKGTGRARQGSTRSPQWVHGGIVFAPKPRSYRTSIPKTMKRVAMKSALSSKVVDSHLLVMDQLTMEAPKTKVMADLLKKLSLKKALIVTGEVNENAWKSARNIEGITIMPCNNINVYDIVRHDTLILTKDAVAKLEEVYA